MRSSKSIRALIPLLYAMILLKNYARGEDKLSSQGGGAAPAAESGQNTVIEVHSDAEFDENMGKHGGRLVVVDFTASWCSPCKFIAPHFKNLASTYQQNIMFLKVDIDECRGTASEYGIMTVPTFICYREKLAVSHEKGADIGKIKAMINKQLTKENLTALFLDRSQSECLNCSDTPEHEKFTQFLENENSHLESDSKDPRLLISLTFTQTVKLHSLKINAPVSNGPKRIKLYINLPNTIELDKAANDEIPAKQTLELKSDDLEGKTVNLMRARFPQVRKLQIFIESNQSAQEKSATRIDNLIVVGSPVETTNMSDLSSSRNTAQ